MKWFKRKFHHNGNGMNERCESSNETTSLIKCGATKSSFVATYRNDSTSNGVSQENRRRRLSHPFPRARDSAANCKSSNDLGNRRLSSMPPRNQDDFPGPKASDLTSSLPSYTIDKGNNGRDETADFDKAITLCGHGRYHYGLFLLCGFILMCAALQNGLNAYILPSAGCDLQLSSQEKGWLNVGFLAGGTVSAMLWGIIADVFGRKNVIGWTLLVDGLITLVSSFSSSFIVLFAFRFLNGFVISASGTLIFSYVGEFQREDRSAKIICYVGLFFTLAWLILPGIAWFVIPLKIDMVFGMSYNSWRLFVALIALPELFCALLLTRYPESPKFLLSQGKRKEALKIFQDIFSLNTGKTVADYPVKILLADDSMSSKMGQTKNNFSTLFADIRIQIFQLFTPPLLKYAVLCSTMLFANMFGYYGLGLWLPELFNRFENHYKLHPNDSVTVCELSKYTESSEQPSYEALARQINPASTESFSSIDISTDKIFVETHCTDTIDKQVFINALIVNAVSLCGNVASGYLSDHLERRVLPIVTMVSAGILGFAVYFVRSAMQNLIVACLFSMFIATGNMVLNSVIVDIFPTNVGAMAVCLSTLLGRIGAIVSNLLFGLLLDINCAIPIFFIGAVVIFGGALGLLIPSKSKTIETGKTKDRTLPP